MTYFDNSWVAFTKFPTSNGEMFGKVKERKNNFQFSIVQNLKIKPLVPPTEFNALNHYVKVDTSIVARLPENLLSISIYHIYSENNKWFK